ncbi:MAG: carbohydrate ABC transporter permease [Ktedonobacteraceae bacterium]|nr:carbohydrate ABC transporter permease [Ktedonobacteraceae bacterium]MBO0794579.1 carbohydrate ABC transporter permease [Ktedonobacteraceae bacterium]
MTLSRRKQIRVGMRASYYVTCTALAILFLAPIVWTIVTSLKPPPEASASPPTFLPSYLSWGNYQHLLTFAGGVGTYAFNSATAALGTVIFTLVLSTLGGYGFSRFRFPGKDILFVTILATLMIPFQSILVPLFLVLRTIELHNTLLGLMLVYTTFQLPFGVFVMRNAFDSVPREIEEAGLIDGCSSWSLLYRVMLTIVLPGIITVGMFAFFNSWNEFLAALIFMTDSSKFTLPIMLLNASSGQYGAIDWGMIQAGITISMLPCLVLFLFLQRYYVSGLAAGAVKA